MITPETYRLMEDENPENRKRAIRQIGQSGDASALSLLKELAVHDPDESVRALAQRVWTLISHQRHEIKRNKEAIDTITQDAFARIKREAMDVTYRDPSPDSADSDSVISHRIRLEMLKYFGVIYVGILLFMMRMHYVFQELYKVSPQELETPSGLELALSSSFGMQVIACILLTLISLVTVIIQANFIHIIATRVFGGKGGLSYFVLGFVRENRVFGGIALIYLLGIALPVSDVISGMLTCLGIPLVLTLVSYFGDYTNIRLMLHSKFVGIVVYVITVVSVAIVNLMFSELVLTILFAIVGTPTL